MSAKKKIVIVGAGFGGLAAAKALAKRDLDVLLIDRTNHHLFQPLLYQVATAALSPADIATATRALFKPQSGVSVLLDEVDGVNPRMKTVSTVRSGDLDFDYLVLATGASYSFFGNEEWSEFAPVLKTLSDALSIRAQLLSAFERAERSDDPEEVERLLTFVVIGAGPTGVEMAGAIAELSRTTLAKDYRRIDPSKARILLIEAGPRILSAFTPKQSAAGLKSLQSLGVTPMIGQAVKSIDAAGVDLGNGRIESPNVFWCAGTQGRQAGAWLHAETARNKAVIVKPDCSVPGHPDIFVIGDAASYQVGEGHALPGLAPVAKQQGRYVAEMIQRRISGKQATRPFRYRNWGTMAVIGHSRAVADFGWLRLSGFTAWLTWSLVHLMLLVDFRSRMSVYTNWTWAWITKGRGVRLLTREEDARAEVSLSLPSSRSVG
ncbi:NAD(P)/FAD-dependent oxidoreductase [Sphingomonas sp. CLY1604]|uniref:NAD(P)/FAD-dependent oxidoreductase n=1 Tax=Sphingomonas sp. CLY1604 TaxID=3457786 RepID=UPI003FD75074